jgi:predicted nucleotidyltransferase
MKRLKPATIHPAIAELVDQLTGLGAKRVILYGSRARGDNLNDRADVDLAVDAEGIDRRVWSKMLETKENARTLLEIDLVHLQDVPSRMRDNILQDGKVLQ